MVQHRLKVIPSQRPINTERLLISWRHSLICFWAHDTLIHLLSLTEIFLTRAKGYSVHLSNLRIRINVSIWIMIIITSFECVYKQSVHSVGTPVFDTHVSIIALVNEINDAIISTSAVAIYKKRWMKYAMSRGKCQMRTLAALLSGEAVASGILWQIWCRNQIKTFCAFLWSALEWTVE